MKNKLSLIAIALLISGCGGGGGGSGSVGAGSGSDTTTPTPALASINAAAALKSFIGTDRTISNLESDDGSLGTGYLSIASDPSSKFILNGAPQETATTKIISFLRSNASGKLAYRYTWKLNFDAQMKPVGVAIGHADAGFTDCMSVTSKSDLPTSTNSSGIYFSGVQSSTYLEGFRSGVYANYCDTTTTVSPSNFEWSVAEGSPNPYFCLTTPNSSSTPKTRICIPVSSSGELNNSVWVRLLNSDGSGFVDYKNTALNKPVEKFSTSINPSNYWYGAVWRPLDGYIYESYESIKFSSQQACRDQTAIDWKKTYSASNVSWTCINVISK